MNGFEKDTYAPDGSATYSGCPSFEIEDYHYYSLCFASRQCGYITLGTETLMGSSITYLIKTTDGGKTWQYVTFLGRYAPSVQLYFTDENHGMIVSSNNHGGSGSVIVNKTTDGGKNWALEKKETGSPLNTDDSLTDGDYSVFALAPYMSNTAWTVPVYAYRAEGENIIGEKLLRFTSKDSGNTWLLETTQS